MADYQPLIQRAVEGLTEPKTAARRDVYERARTALAAQLAGVTPPLPEIDIARERRALDDAIARVEREFPAEAEPDLDAFERKGEGSPAGTAPSVAPAPVAAEPPSFEAESLAPRGRPRIETVAPKPAMPGRWRPAILAGGIAVPILGIALVAFLYRQDPATLPQRPTTAEGTAGTEGGAKVGDRVAGSDRVSPAVAPSGGGAASAPPRPEIPSAQRAILYEENPAQPQQPRASAGRAVWRLDNLNAGQGQPLETVVRATVEVPDAGMTMTMLIRRNTETTLPASHTVELTFAGTGPQARAIRDIGLLQLKNEEGTRGAPIAGLPVPVRENLFLIGLSNLPGDVERNVDLLFRRSWLDLPLRFTNGQRAILSFEKGPSGEQVLAEAFKAWR